MSEKDPCSDHIQSLWYQTVQFFSNNKLAFGLTAGDEGEEVKSFILLCKHGSDLWRPLNVAISVKGEEEVVSSLGGSPETMRDGLLSLIGLGRLADHTLKMLQKGMQEQRRMN